MKEALNYLDNLLKNSDTIVVACSGGPDSMALLNALKDLKLKKLNIICAHVNHGLRKESEKEAKFVQKYCEENNIIFEYMIIEKYKNKKFTESEGREKRYAFFEELITKYNAKYLMTAHHGDDLIETMLMRIVRGSNIKGYVGIPKIIEKDKYQIVRPLLTATKNEIIEYLKKNKIKYMIDKSNDDESYTRNRFRKHMLPILKKEDKNVHEKFLKCSQELERVNNYIEKIIELKINNIYKDGVIDLENLKKEDQFLQEQIIKYVIELIQKEIIFNIDDNQFNSIIKLINNKSSSKINLADGVVVRKSYNKLYFENNNINNEDKEYEYILNDELTIKNKHNFKIIKNSNLKNNNILRINSEEITLPIIIRSRKKGDVMKIKNLNGSKKIKDIFIDSKIDLEERKVYPIVTDSKNNIIWIPGLKKSIFDKEINEKYDIIVRYMEEKHE